MAGRKATRKGTKFGVGEQKKRKKRAAAITAMSKALDPHSIVRESEFLRTPGGVLRKHNKTALGRRK